MPDPTSDAAPAPVGSSTDAADAPTRRGKIRALLAGGLILGLGATFTLAAWTDKAFVTSDFGTGTFDIEANVSSPFNSGGWADYGSSPGGTLTFSIPTSSVVPGVPIYAPVSLRTASGSLAAQVTLEAATTSGSSTLSAALRYRVVQDSTCNASAFSAGAVYVIGSSSTPAALTTGSAPNAISLPADGATTAPSGKAYCFELSLPDTPANQSLQGLSATAIWQFTATS
jgi:predicted ribosomally synthesized peptide with SipW-like signal peptide